MDLILGGLDVNIFKLASVSESYSSPHFAPDDTTMTQMGMCA